MSQRDTSRDGWRNRLEYHILTHYGWFWRWVQRAPWARRRLNRILINRAVGKTKPRPHALSTRSDYPSWDSLTDRTFSGRHLPPADPAYTQSLPALDDVVDLFRRPAGHERLSDKSTLLFSHFAQWFTDGFLRTDRQDIRKNTSNHDIDLSPLYGIRSIHTQALRAGCGGKLKSQVCQGEEYPPFAFDPSGAKKAEFQDLPVFVPPGLPLERQLRMFAMGVERANNQLGYVMLNTLFLREHNRIATALEHAYPTWDDERLFQTARNTLIALLIKIVVEEYINHITPYYFHFQADPASFWDAPWYRTNWMTVEFNLLYRWHGLVTNTVTIGDETLPLEETLVHNQLLLDRGLAAWFQAASRQRAGDIGLFNTHPALLGTETASLRIARELRLQPYNAYRVAFGYPALTSFEQISSRPEVQNRLQALYGHADRLEFYVGLFAEDVRPHSALSPLIGRMVGVDAFSQALTNPLLSIHVFRESTFSPVGWKVLQDTQRLQQIVERNVPHVPADFGVFLTQGGKAIL